MSARSQLLFSRVIAAALLASSSTVAMAVAQSEATPQLHSHDDAAVQADVQHLPVLKPAPPYTDSDKAARQPTMQELGLKGQMDLAALRVRADRKSGDWRLQALVGQMEHLAGDRAAAEARYLRAVAAAGTSKDRQRHVLWSRGWARMYTGDMQGALTDWRDAAALHGGKPEWYPHTVALAYWRAGLRPLGMQWFEASQLASSAEGRQQLPYLGLPMIAQSLIGDMFRVHELRANPGTPRLGAGAPEFEDPAYIASPAPIFPHSAVTSRRQGRVMTLVCVDSHGDPKAMQVAKSTGHADLDKVATSAIGKWQFRPRICAGKPRDSWVAVPIEFLVMKVPAGAKIPERLLRRPWSDKFVFGPGCRSDVGLDPAGYTAVTSSCDSEVVCSAEAVWTQKECDKAPKAATGGEQGN